MGLCGFGYVFMGWSYTCWDANHTPNPGGDSWDQRVRLVADTGK